MTPKKVMAGLERKVVNGAKKNWPDWLRTVAYIGIAVIAGLYAADQRVNALDTRVAIIESNRFEAEDGTKVWEAIARTQERDGEFFRRLDAIDTRLGNIENVLMGKGDGK
jgi:hypothetical protein